MIYVDCSSERPCGKLTGGDGREDLAGGAHHVLADVWGSEEVVDHVQTKSVEHSGEKDISEMDDSKQNTKLKNLTEEKLSEIPVVLLEGEDE